MRLVFLTFEFDYFWWLALSFVLLSIGILLFDTANLNYPYPISTYIPRYISSFTMFFSPFAFSCQLS